MILHGHDFLRSDYLENAPVRSTANLVNAKRIPDILKHIQGMGCQVLKPVDAEGKNWVISLYGTDIQPPPGVDDPWTANMVDQFRVKKAAAQVKLYVYGGTLFDLHPISGSGAPGTPVTWSVAEPDTEDVSDPVPIADGETLKLYAMLFENTAPGDGTWGYLVVFAIDAASDADAAATAWLVEVGLSGCPFDLWLLATATRDDSSSPHIVIDAVPAAPFSVTAPVTKDHFVILGGVWQYLDGTETIAVEPEDGDITWPAGDADTDNDSAVSESCDASGDAASVIWAKLDLTSVTPSLKLMLLSVDPVWAADIYWRKIASITRNGDPAVDPAQVTLTIHQHHSGSPEGLANGEHGFLDAWVAGVALGSSTAVPPTTDDWMAVPVVATRIDGDQFEITTNAVKFLSPAKKYLVICTGQFSISASGSAGAGAPKFSIQAVALCKGSGDDSKGIVIHDLTQRKDTFLQHPSFASGDDPPLTIPAASEHYASFAMATIICPEDDLTLPGDPEADPPVPDIDNTLSIWAKGRGTIDAELVIMELHNPIGDAP
jgi:hypothetical protein